MKTINIGIIGTGHVFKYYKNAIKSNKLFNISGVFDIKRVDKRDRADIKICDSIEDLLSTNPDVVAILTDASSRYEVAKKILTNKLPVILEKPPVETIEQYDELIDLSEKNQVFIFGALHSRYTATSVYVRNKMLVTEKGSFHEDFGKLKKIELCRFDPYIKNGKLEKTPEKTSGLDSWPNILAELSLYVDKYKIKNVLSLDTTHSPQSIEVKSEISGKISGGGIFIGKTDWTQNINEKITCLEFTKGSVIMNHTLQKVFEATSEGKKEVIDFSNMGERMEIEYYYMLNEVYDIYFGLKESNESSTRKILSNTLLCYKNIETV